MGKALSRGLDPELEGGSISTLMMDNCYRSLAKRWLLRGSFLSGGSMQVDDEDLDVRLSEVLHNGEI